ncbi:hypothetical protein IE077_002641 [Cardiosporidium cionae]|uniref:Uncharacterized protein n=1 Tax=Cardiosporidium cionae TaxID=476202 RepID=A0ABQ7JA97_9APIC|nr:hypothetical protein IE077_002641 [Cardiosporidium cionae]|eukprot:KAF8820925.1 hypothetical protein IE077_002641 [Cardiosporidium cionae]
MELRIKRRCQYVGSDNWESRLILDAKQRIGEKIWTYEDSCSADEHLKVVQERKKVVGKGLQCTAPLPEFSYFYFRGDVVLSPWNAVNGIINRRWINPKYNPGMNPISHLSPHFTPHDTQEPFTLCMQAAPYIDDSQMQSRVKAIFANHYCIRHCQGFFATDPEGLPLVVVRPGGARRGPFGVYYGVRNEFNSFPCAEPRCCHKCIKGGCDVCGPSEKAWLRQWRCYLQTSNFKRLQHIRQVKDEAVGNTV